jgi:molybdenum cofactor cytidylyltransferase
MNFRLPHKEFLNLWEKSDRKFVDFGRSVKLLDVLRLDSPPCLAIVGSGGKTATLFRLAREIIQSSFSESEQNTVLLTSTTHLGVEQALWADHHFVIKSMHDLIKVEKDLPLGVLLFTGREDKENRVAGLSGLALDYLYNLSQNLHLPLLIEADESCKPPLKAPADYEPQIPDWVEQVIVVLGLSGLGKPLDEQWVHRVDLFARLSGLSGGEKINVLSLAKVVNSPQGGLKAIRKDMQRIIILNQADTKKVQSDAYRLARYLLPHYSAVLVSSLNSSRKDHHPVISSEEIVAVHENIAGIILAAGGSQRYGSPKQTLTWHGQPFIRHIARVALSSDLNPLLIITGNADERVRAAVSDLSVSCVYNPEWQKGQSTSVIQAIRALPNSIGASIIMLVDQPQVSVTLLQSLIEMHKRTQASIITPQVDHKRVNPVLFDRRLFNKLLKISGDQGGRALFSSQRISWIDWIDPRAEFDIDTPEDYDQLIRLYSGM